LGGVRSSVVRAARWWNTLEKTRRHGISAVSFEQCRRSGISADRSAFGDRGENNIVHLLSKLVASFWKLMTK
jgi:hypothetical protein